jgi:hypothetical protein
MRSAWRCASSKVMAIGILRRRWHRQRFEPNILVSGSGGHTR